MDIAAIVIAVLSGSAMTAAIGAIAGRGKSRADTAKQLTETATDLIGPLRKELATVRNELAAVRSEANAQIEALRNEVAAMRNDLTSERSIVEIAVRYISQLVADFRTIAPDHTIREPPEQLERLLRDLR